MVSFEHLLSFGNTIAFPLFRNFQKYQTSIFGDRVEFYVNTMDTYLKSEFLRWVYNTYPNLKSSYSRYQESAL